MERPEGKFPASFDTYQAVETNDLIFCLFDVDETPRTVGIARQSGMVTGAYDVFRCADSELAEFVYLFFLSVDEQKGLRPFYTGLRKVVKTSTFLGIKISIPPPAERKAIVRYLDYMDRRIRRYIAAKRKLIALLSEQKQAIIHQGVTRGLDPTVPLKTSGVPWLGDVPRHWETRRLKPLLSARITDGPHTTPTFYETGVPFISVDGIQDGELTFENCRHVTPTDHAEFVKKAQPMMDDILFGKAASTGKIARVKVDFPFSIWSPVALIRPNQSKVLSGYLEYLLKDIDAQTQIEWLCTSNTQKNISMDDIPRLILLVPPLAEQRAIMHYLANRLSDTNAAIQRVRREMALVQEYGSRLVADVVTGKLDVREVAAGLPDYVAEGQLGEDDEVIASNDNAGNADLDGEPVES